MKAVIWSFILVAILFPKSYTCRSLDDSNCSTIVIKVSELSGSGGLNKDDAYLTVPEIVAKHGYPVEIHSVTTDDGYILEIHRIPFGKNGVGANKEMRNKPVVWLQHGLLADSSNWILNDENKAMAYSLADAGYDVWMGNARGNTYSKKHVTLTPKNSAFWQFSWNEMGLYDIPAVLNYCLEKTQKPNLHYIGHSMGTTMFFVAMDAHPELNSKIKLMIALAPIAYVVNMKSPLVLLGAKLGIPIDFVTYFLGINEFMPSNLFMDFLGATICRAYSLFQSLCSNVLFLIAGYNSDQLNKAHLPIILSHTPAGASVRSLLHYAQGVNSGQFRNYDFGKSKNLKVYGSQEPAAYDISKISAPVGLFYGQNDWLGTPPDVLRLAEELPNLARIYRIRHDKYNHLDFLWAKDNDQLLVRPVLDFMKEHEGL